MIPPYLGPAAVEVVVVVEVVDVVVVVVVVVVLVVVTVVAGVVLQDDNNIAAIIKQLKLSHRIFLFNTCLLINFLFALLQGIVIRYYNTSPLSVKLTH